MPVVTGRQLISALCFADSEPNKRCASQTQSLAASIDYVAAHYHPDMKDFIVYCISQPGVSLSSFSVEDLTEPFLQSSNWGDAVSL